jgi:hypothetical protein
MSLKSSKRKQQRQGRQEQQGGQERGRRPAKRAIVVQGGRVVHQAESPVLAWAWGMGHGGGEVFVVSKYQPAVNDRTEPAPKTNRPGNRRSTGRPTSERPPG